MYYLHHDQINVFLLYTPAFYNTSTTLTDIKFGKESKTIIVVDTSLHPLNLEACKNKINRSARVLSMIGTYYLFRKLTAQYFLQSLSSNEDDICRVRNASIRGTHYVMIFDGRFSKA